MLILLINKKAEKKTATATRHHYSYETSAHKQNKGVQKKQTKNNQIFVFLHPGSVDLKKLQYKRRNLIRKAVNSSTQENKFLVQI